MNLGECLRESIWTIYAAIALRNGPSGAVIRIASRQAAQNPGGEKSCGTYVIVNQYIPKNRLRKSAQAIIGM